MSFTTEQAYELGYALAYRGELINAANEGMLQATRLGRATYAMWQAAEDVITGGDAANYELAEAYARGSNAGYADAIARIKTGMEAARA